MFEPTVDTNDNYVIWEEIINDLNLSGIDVLKALTDWHGLQLLDKDCTKNFLEDFLED